jgi:hypothetical protein
MEQFTNSNKDRVREYFQVCRWVDNIKMGLVEIEWSGVDWTGSG